MSYINEKKQMTEEMLTHRKRVSLVIKITFVLFAIALFAFATLLVVGLVKGGLFAIGKDNTPPTITAREGTTVIGYVGDVPTYKKYVIVSDDKDKEPKLYMDYEDVDVNKEGSYTIKYRAVDASGNKSEIFKITYVVKSKEYAEETLMEMIAKKAKELGITSDLSTRKKVEKIFNYVHNLFRYADDSNIPDIDRSKWKEDWVEEAVRTITDETGDCYSYYSLSKAFFEYFDIENIGIMRDPKSTLEGTHYWSIVNIGENGKDAWYYYDATRLAGSFGDGSQDACLITQETLDTHKTSKGATDFYLMTTKSDYLDFSSAGGIKSLPDISKEKLK